LLATACLAVLAVFQLFLADFSTFQLLFITFSRVFDSEDIKNHRLSNGVAFGHLYTQKYQKNVKINFDFF